MPETFPLGLLSIGLACLTFWVYWTLRVRFSGRKRVRIVTVSGPSGAGKTTVVKELLRRHPEWEIVLSWTSRGPRESDLPGEYKCNISKAVLNRAKQLSELMWLEVVHGNLYATLRDSVDKACCRRTLSLMPIVPKSVKILYGYIPSKMRSIFILPPDEEELRRRLTERGDLPEQIERRIVDCKKWEQEARISGVPYEFVRNDGTISEAVEKVEQIISKYL